MTKNWYPIIDYSRCVGCLTCVNFCPHGVYTEKGGKPFVKNKEACVDLCKGCEKICPEKAITHHTK
jgi:NAD-dependent dihydropyrimidine dehydrogenase PreA subunit